MINLLVWEWISLTPKTQRLVNPLLTGYNPWYLAILRVATFLGWWISVTLLIGWTPDHQLKPTINHYLRKKKQIGYEFHEKHRLVNRDPYLLGGFNPSKKYESKWISSLARDENKWNHRLVYYNPHIVGYLDVHGT